MCRMKPALCLLCRVVANLPYNITTEFLKQLLPLSPAVQRATIMLQVGVCICMLWFKGLALFAVGVGPYT